MLSFFISYEPCTFISQYLDMNKDEHGFTCSYLNTAINQLYVTTHNRHIYKLLSYCILILYCIDAHQK